MSLLPRLAPTDVEMSLTGLPNLPAARVAGCDALLVTDRVATVGSICLSSPCGDEAMYNARALSLSLACAITL